LAHEFQRWRVTGTVQGVGFRPFIYRLARSFELPGWVRNDLAGVTIEAWGAPEVLARFAAAIASEAPPAARVASVTLQDRGVGEAPVGFRIILSEELGGAGAVTAISPDLPVCDDCLREMRDPRDRRHGYPFINCTNCGPRYSIIEALPYDRPLTSMRAFPMCPACEAEYHDPGDRRFHAQPTACEACGPRVRYLPSSALAGLLDPDPWRAEPYAEEAWQGDAIAAAVAALRAGQVLAIKGLGGYHLACDARSAVAVGALRARKFRKEKPFALMARDPSALDGVVVLDAAAAAALAGVARPIVLAPKGEVALPETLAPENAELGVMLPYTPLQHLLFDAGAPALLVMTSANRSSEPIEYRDAEALLQLAPLADAFLLGERPIVRRVDDSVTQVIAGRVAVARRARGYAPEPVLRDARFTHPRLALGAELKSSLALAVEGQVVVSHHLGDLTDLASFQAFQETVFDLCAMWRLDPATLPVVHDLHPHYASSRFAARLGGPRSAVQHHRAHIASALAEHGLWETPVLGFAFDGAGLGDDGVVWGGEIFHGTLAGGLRRVGHLREVPLPGGDAAARTPRQAAIGFLSALGDVGVERVLRPPFDFDPAKVALVRQLIARGLHTPRTTSVGRLFDSVAALVGFDRRMSFEGQAAIALEALAREVIDDRPYPWPFADGVWDHAPLFEALLLEREAGVGVARIARRFHETLARGVLAAAAALRRQWPFEGIALSGGVFQNRLLLERVLTLSALEGVTVVRHAAVPTNDGGVALGQLALAAVQPPA
jgi:hydrogenase maturation protein HypF